MPCPQAVATRGGQDTPNRNLSDGDGAHDPRTEAGTRGRHRCVIIGSVTSPREPHEHAATREHRGRNPERATSLASASTASPPLNERPWNIILGTKLDSPCEEFLRGMAAGRRYGGAVRGARVCGAA